MPTTGFLDVIDTYVNKRLLPTAIDNVFKYDPMLAYLRKNNIEIFPGGSAIQENIRYAGLKGGPYPIGGKFNITQKQTNTGATYYPKTYYVNVTEQLEIINVYVKGPEAPFKKVDSDMQNATDTMAANLSIGLYQNGSRAGYTDNLNGFAEIINDNSVASWDGSTYATLGTLTRGGVIGAAMNGLVVAVAGPTSFGILDTSFRRVTIGSEMPNIGVTTNLGLSYIVQKFQPMQRVEGTDPNIGFTGLKFNNAIILQSQYCPGTAISATNDPIVTEYMAQLGLVYPTMTAETFFWLNTKMFKLHVTNDPLMGFGFSGFKRSQDDNTVAGQYFFAGNVTCSSPRLQAQLTGITA